MAKIGIPIKQAHEKKVANEAQQQQVAECQNWYNGEGFEALAKEVVSKLQDSISINDNPFANKADVNDLINSLGVNTAKLEQCAAMDPTVYTSFGVLISADNSLKDGYQNVCMDIDGAIVESSACSEGYHSPLDFLGSFGSSYCCIPN